MAFWLELRCCRFSVVQCYLRTKLLLHYTHKTRTDTVNLMRLTLTLKLCFIKKTVLDRCYKFVILIAHFDVKLRLNPMNFIYSSVSKSANVKETVTEMWKTWLYLTLL